MIFCNVLFAGIMILLSTNVSAQGWDVTALRRINNGRDKALDKPFIVLDKSVDPVTFGTPAAMLLTGLVKRDSVLLQQGVVAGVSVLANAGASFVLKNVVDRKRPYDVYPFIDNALVKSGGSFPSGSTSSSFALATSLALATKKWYVAVPTFAYAGAVAYSRLHLGVHYPSDVLAGAALGTGSALVTHCANQWLQRKKTEHSR